jgi:putative transposase
VTALLGEYPANLLCRILEVPRSSFYYRSKKSSPAMDLLPLKNLIRVIRTTFRGCGVRSAYRYLVRDYTRYSLREVRQAYVEMGILGKVHPRRPRTTDSRKTERRFPDLVKGLTLTGPNHVWVGDVTEFRIGSRSVYLVLLMDAFSRMILGWALSSRNDTELAMQALEMALATGKPHIHHTDQGTPYGSKLYVAKLEDYGITSSMAEQGRPKDNAKAERLNRTLKYEDIRLSEYRNLAEASQGIQAFVLKYNTRRMHQSLKNQTPNQIHQQKKNP